MCVILIAQEKRLTEGMIRKAFDSNDAGAGIAYREGGFVHWKKGLDLDEIVELCAKVPLPFVAHFRVPSVGGRCTELTHPFPVSADCKLDLEGKTKGFVLFHNGHWGPWRNHTLETARTFGAKVPVGKWSDSRAMAWSAHLYGHGVLEFIDEKVVLFGPNNIEVFSGSSFVKIDGIGWASNRSFEGGGTYTYGGRYHQRDHSYHTTPPASMVGGTKKEDDDTKPVVKTASAAKKGNDGVLPFDQAWELYKNGKLSKKQFKKARRKFEAEMKAKGVKCLPMATTAH